jgi:protein transport protein SEC31
LFKTKIAERVTSLAWTSYGSDSEERKYGLLIGGLANGNLAFWNPIENLKNMTEDSLNNYRCVMNKDIGEQSPINCLAVNPHKRNLVVSGGSTVLIHNIDKGCKNVDSFAPAQVTADTSTVTSVGWNWKVAHIFASAADNGVATVWDLKNKKAIMNLADQNYSLDMFSADSLQ